MQAFADGECAANAETSPEAYEGFHSWAVEHRFVRVLCDEPGQTADWMRFKVPLLPDEPTSALCRVCAVADVGLGLSSEPPRGSSMSAPDLTVHLQHHPRGEWVCVDRTPDANSGVGVPMTRLIDRRGSIGHAHRNPRLFEVGIMMPAIWHRVAQAPAREPSLVGASRRDVWRTSACRRPMGCPF